MPAIASDYNTRYLHRKYGKLFYDINPSLALADDPIITAVGAPDDTQNPNAIFIGATDAGYEFSAEGTIVEEEIDEADSPIAIGVDSIAAQISFDALEVTDIERMAALVPFATYSANTVASVTNRRATGGGSRITLPSKPVMVISPEKSGGFAYAILWAAYNSGAHQLQFKRKDRSKQSMVLKGLAVASRADGDRIYRIGVVDSIVVISSTSPVTPGGTVGTAFTKTFAATGGTAPYTWLRTAGAFPNGLVLNASTGVLAGTPTQAGTFNYTLRATDANGRFTEKAFVHVVA